jgi:hypothetical protein
MRLAALLLLTACNDGFVRSPTIETEGSLIASFRVLTTYRDGVPRTFIGASVADLTGGCHTIAPDQTTLAIDDRVIELVPDEKLQFTRWEDAVATSYDFETVYGASRLRFDATMPPPIEVRLVVPGVGQPGRIEWTPSGLDLETVVDVFDLDGDGAEFHARGDDVGAYAIPASTFDHAGEWKVEIWRRAHAGWSPENPNGGRCFGSWVTDMVTATTIELR